MSPGPLSLPATLSGRPEAQPVLPLPHGVVEFRFCQRGFRPPVLLVQHFLLLELLRPHLPRGTITGGDWVPPRQPALRNFHVGQIFPLVFSVICMVSDPEA